MLPSTTGGPGNKTLCLRGAVVTSLRCSKYDNVITVIVIEGISDTDIDVGIADQVQVVIEVRLIVDPPVDHTLPGEWRITSVNIFGDERKYITGIRNPLLDGRTIRTCVRE